jgi:tetratricopeptide (TPR) repeat protein
MRKCFQFPALMGLLVLLAGCGTVPSKSPRTPRETAAEPPLSAQAAERRAEAHAHYATAVVHDWNEEVEKAAEEYHAAAMSDPLDQLLVLECAQRLMQLKQPEKALEVLTKASDAPDASGPIFAQMGRIFALQGNKERAREAFRSAIRRSPGSMMGYRYLAQMHLQNREHEETLKVLDQAWKQHSTDPLFLIELGDLHVAFLRAKPDDSIKKRALDLFERAAKLQPTNIFWLQTLADGFAGLGESEKALPIYLELIQHRPTLPGVREKLTELYLRQKDRKKAVEQLEAIIRDNPVSPQAYYLLGTLAFEEKEFKEAIESFRKTILLNPNFEPAYYDLAAAQLNLKQPRDAITTIEKTRARFKESFSSEYYAAMAYGVLKDYTNAIKHLTAAEIIARATETNRLNHKFYFQIGSAYERMQKYEDAENYFRKCIEMAPDYSEALNYLGYMWAERGTNLTEARELIEKALKLEPKNAAYLDSMAWVLFKLDQPQEALTWQLQALENSEDPDPTLYDHLGDIYFALEDRDKARESWQKALAIEPNQKIQEKLESDTASGPRPRQP